VTPRKPQEFSLLWAWRHSPALSLIAVASVVLALAGLAVPAADLARAFFAKSPAALEAKGEEQRQAEQQAGVFAGYSAQIDGRSVFILPSPPSAPVVSEAEPDEEDAPDAPLRYGGPAIIAAVNGAVWFADGSRLSAGDPAKDGFAVVAMNAPWDVTLRWKGSEFTVPIFERDRAVMPSTPPDDGASGLRDSGSPQSTQEPRLSPPAAAPDASSDTPSPEPTESPSR